MMLEGHNEPCYYCAKLCDSLAGNPSHWPIPLCHEDEPGRVKWHHTGCVTERLIENTALEMHLECAASHLANWTEDLRLKDLLIERAVYELAEALKIVGQSKPVVEEVA